MNWLVEFLFPRRLHRLAYAIRLVSANLALGFCFFAGTAMNSGYWGFGSLAIFIYAIFFILLPRICDLGMSKWWLLITLVPFINDIFGIILLFRAAPILRSPTPPQPTASST